MTPDEAKEAILQHLQRMDRADLIFMFNKGGYVGNSVIMEIGYAYARRKPVYALAPIPDRFLMPLVTAVVSIEELLQLGPRPNGSVSSFDQLWAQEAWCFGNSSRY
jgi:hypothetical protein